MAPLLELEHIVDALKGFKRPVREGRLALENLIGVGVRDQNDDFASVEALCVRATKIHDPPVVIHVQIDKKAEKVEDRIKSLSCTCIAGACKEHSCKHAMAVLIYLEKYVNFLHQLIFNLFPVKFYTFTCHFSQLVSLTLLQD